MTYQQAKTALKEIAEAEQVRAIIDRAAIPEADKMMLRLHYIDDVPFFIIAGEIGYSVDEVYKRHKRAMKKIAKII